MPTAQLPRGKPNGAPTPERLGVSRLPSSIPATLPRIDIKTELKVNRDFYKVTDENRKSLKVYQLPKYLLFCANRLNMQIGDELTGAYPGHHKVLACAIYNGAQILLGDDAVMEFTAHRKGAYLSEVSGMLAMMAAELMGSWTISVSSSSGYMLKSMVVNYDTWKAVDKLHNNLGMPKSLIATLCVVYGMFEQPGLADDHAQQIANCVHEFDVRLSIKSSAAVAIQEFVNRTDEGRRTYRSRRVEVASVS